MEKDNTTYRAWGIGEDAREAEGLKPMPTTEGLIMLLTSKGVTFERCSEEAAAAALSSRDTYLHTAEYRKLFQRHERGERAGQYVGLDFDDLLFLDGLDAELRRTFRLVSSDVERTAKARLVAQISNMPGEDGYGIVSDFMEAQSRGFRRSIEKNLRSRAGSSRRADVYLGELIEHHRSAMPVWVFLEVVPFGTLLAFMLFCAKRWGDKRLEVLHYALSDVKSVRNCCSHGACVINGFGKQPRTPFATSTLVYDWLAAHGVKNGGARRAKLANRRMQQLVTTLVVFDEYVVHDRDASLASLADLRTSLAECVARYGIQNGFVSFVSFLEKIIDKVA